MEKSEFASRIGHATRYLTEVEEITGKRWNLSGEIHGVHVEDDGDVFRERGFPEDGLDVVGEGAGFGGAEGDLEAELVVGADQRAGEDLS